MQATLTITSKGQITLRKEFLQHLGVRAGDKVELKFLPDGSLAISPKGKLPISSLYGILAKNDGRHMTIEEMNEVISDGWAGL